MHDLVGRRITARLVKIVDGGTIKVDLDGRAESVRPACLDTEYSWPGGNKPVTEAGRQASAWTKSWFGADATGQPTAEVSLDLEFDTADPVSLALVRHRDDDGHLLAYLWRESAHVNLAAVSAGWGPHSVKDGRSRPHHGAFLKAEARAQAQGIGVWDLASTAPAPRGITAIYCPGGKCAMAGSRTIGRWVPGPGCCRYGSITAICLPPRRAESR